MTRPITVYTSSAAASRHFITRQHSAALCTALDISTVDPVPEVGDRGLGHEFATPREGRALGVTLSPLGDENKWYS